MKFFFSGLFLLAVATLATQPALAQNLQGLGDNAPGLNVYIDPTHPGPRQQVTINLESFSTDLDRADISWSINSTIEKQGIGKKSFTFNTGSPGTASHVLVVVTTTAGDLLQKSLTIYPDSVDLIWEAQSYTPPFYHGKALYPYQGTVRIIALPNIVAEGGGAINSNNLVYNWKVDGDPVQDASGFGKNVMVFRGSIPIKSNVISVEASSIDQKYTAEGQTVLTPIAPLVLLYAEDPLLGTLFNAILPGVVNLQNQEINITAIPYFSGNLNRDNLNYSWQMNNQALASSKSTLAFQQQTGVSGSADVSVQVSNPTAILEQAGNGLTLSFGDNNAQ